MSATKRFFELNDKHVIYVVVACDLEQAAQILHNAGIEFDAPHELSWKEILAEHAVTRRVHLNDGNPQDPVPLAQCKIGDWFCSEW